VNNLGVSFSFPYVSAAAVAAIVWKLPQILAVSHHAQPISPFVFVTKSHSSSSDCQESAS
jgi:hypothetical protein